MKAPIPPGEEARLAALERYAILDTLAEESYEDITRIASFVAGCPIALISLVDGDRQWFKSHVGLAASETPREYAFCAHAILEPEQTLVVRDATLDSRFATNPLVTGDPDIRFYAGAPLVTPDHHALGTLCVIDRVPRELSGAQLEVLKALSRQVVVQLELRRHSEDLRRSFADRDVYLSQLEVLNGKLKEETLTDRLTGIGNRAAFDLRLKEEVDRAHRYQSPLSLLVLDVDHFKKLNDTYGHPKGDEALRQVARALGCIRPSDFLARIGGEEFAVILPATAPRGARIMAERLRLAVEGAKPAGLATTVSVGSATLRGSDATGSQLMAEADKALYRAKGGGRNCSRHGADAEGNEGDGRELYFDI